MNFIRKGKYYSESKEGYRISMSGPEDNRQFTAWRHKPRITISCHGKSSEAYQACIDHYRENNK